jgi:hypothetical protein
LRKNAQNVAQPIFEKLVRNFNRGKKWWHGEMSTDRMPTGQMPTDWMPIFWMSPDRMPTGWMSTG